MNFSDMNIDERIKKTLSEMGFQEATEIQEKAIPICVSGKDVIAQAMTGSGKTLVFAIPIIQGIRKGGGVQSLVLVPTRELADQVADSIAQFSKNTPVNVCKVFGGVSIEPQIHNLQYSEIVVGTPGRIMDHMERRTINLSRVKILVLDEADRMLDMGFIDDIEHIIRAVPRDRQTMLFSATMPEPIKRIAQRYMRDTAHIKVQHLVSSEKLKQYYYDVNDNDKLSLLIHLIKKENPALAIVFCATKRTTDMVARVLQKFDVEAKAIHGDLSQQQRMKVLESFHKGFIHILVATDVAARGLDIKDISHIFNYDAPNSAEDYTHRIGRTARIGKEGKAILLLSKKDHDVFRKIVQWIPGIEKATENFEHLKMDMYPERRPFRRSSGGGSRGGSSFFSGSHGDHRGQRSGSRSGPHRRRFSRR